jgi:hypothetical protein
MQLKMSSDNLHEIFGTYSEIEALKKFTRLECLAPDLVASCDIGESVSNVSRKIMLPLSKNERNGLNLQILKRLAS